MAKKPKKKVVELLVKVRAPEGISDRKVAKLVNRLLDAAWEDANAMPDDWDDPEAAEILLLDIMKPKVAESKPKPEPKPELPHCEGFTCQSCGSHRLEEIGADCTLSTEILSVGPGGDVEYGLENADSSITDHYQCLNCGWVIPNVTDSEELAEFLGVEDEGEGYRLGK